MRRLRILLLFCCTGIAASWQTGLAQQPQEYQQTAPLEQAGVQTAITTLPDSYRLNMMIRSSIIALNHANKTGNYTVLLDLAAPSFRASNDSSRLAQIFARLRQRKLDLSPILFFTPKLLQQPQIAPNGLFRLVGFFPTTPERVNFDLYFQMIGDEWKLFGIGVEMSPADVTASVATNTQGNTPNAPSANPGASVRPSASEVESNTAPAPVASAPVPERRPTGSSEVANDSNSEDLQTAVENGTTNNATRIDFSVPATGKTEQVDRDAVDSGPSLWDNLFSSD
jgi:hypothetical protein